MCSSDLNVKAVQDAVRAGVTVTIATGRMYKAALPVAEALGTDVPIITYNGALIRSVGGTVYDKHTLTPELVRRAIAFFRERGWYLQTYSNDELYFPVHDEHAKLYESTQKVTGHETGWDHLGDYTDNACKMLHITDSPEETAERVKILQKEFAGDLAVVQSNPRYVELIEPGVSKASALERLAVILHVKRDEVMAIGDSYNDLPMLRAAGLSVAMGNAVQAVKDSCQVVTGTCDEGGFAAAVYRYALGKEDSHVD